MDKDQPAKTRIEALAAFARAFWANRGILSEPAWRQDKIFLRCALTILTQKHSRKQESAKQYPTTENQVPTKDKE